MMTFLTFAAGAVSEPRILPVDVIGMCVSGAGMVLVRHTGIVVVLAAAAVIALLRWRAARSRRGLWPLAMVVGASLFAALAAAGANLVIAGAALGGRAAPNANLLENGMTALFTVAGWLLPLPAIATLPMVRFGLVVLAGLIIVSVRCRYRRNSLTEPSRMLLILAVLYALSMVLLSSLTNTDPLADRLMIPVLPLLVIGAAPVLHSVIQPGGQAGRWNPGPLGLWVGWLILSMTRVVASVV